MIIKKTASGMFSTAARKTTRKKVPVLSGRKNMVIKNLFQ